MKSTIVLLGLPSPGLQGLSDSLGIQHIEDAEIRSVCDHPLELTGFAFDQMSRKVAGCTQGRKRRVFLMVYAAPAEFLERQTAGAAEMMSAPEEVESFAARTLEFWRAYHLALLDQYRRNEGNALLINGDRTVVMDALLPRLEQAFGAQFAPTCSKSAAGIDSLNDTRRESFSQIVDSLAPECLELYAELESCAELMGRQPEFEFGGLDQQKTQTLEMLQLLVETGRINRVLNRHGLSASDLGTRLDASRQEQRRLADSVEQNLHKLSVCQDEIRSLHDQCAQLSTKAAASEANTKTLQNENELLLLQLHQVQEELKRSGLLCQKNEEQLTKARAEHNKLVTDRQAEIERLTKERDQAKQLYQQLNSDRSASEASTKKLRNDNDLLLLQLHQVQEELEHYYLLNQKSEQQLGEVQKKLDARSASFWKKFGMGARAFKGAVLGFVAPQLRPAGALIAVIGKRKRALKHQIIMIKGSGAFDEQWYLEQYPDVVQAGYDPVEHYLKFGISEGRNPSAHFDTRWYLESNPDVADAKMNPLLHYIKFGKGEGRQPMRYQA